MVYLADATFCALYVLAMFLSPVNKSTLFWALVAAVLGVANVVAGAHL